MPGGVVLGQRDGRATGDCYVTFASPSEAQRAMVMNNKHMVGANLESTHSHLAAHQAVQIKQYALLFVFILRRARVTLNSSTRD